MRIFILIFLVIAVLATTEGFLDKLFGAAMKHLGKKSNRDKPIHKARKEDSIDLNVEVKDRDRITIRSDKRQRGYGSNGVDKHHKDGWDWSKNGDPSGMDGGYKKRRSYEKHHRPYGKELPRRTQETNEHKLKAGWKNWAQNWDDATDDWGNMIEGVLQWGNMLMEWIQKVQHTPVKDAKGYMNDMWNNLDDENKKLVKGLHKKLISLFQSAAKDTRKHIHQFKLFLKESGRFENKTLGELKDEFLKFAKDEFEHDIDSFNETVQWFNGELNKQNSTAATVLGIMQKLKETLGQHGFAGTMDHTKSKMKTFWHVVAMMKKNFAMLSKQFGRDEAKLQMVKWAKLMLRKLDLFEEGSDECAGPRSDICLCI